MQVSFESAYLHKCAYIYVYMSTSVGTDAVNDSHKKAMMLHKRALAKFTMVLHELALATGNMENMENVRAREL